MGSGPATPSLQSQGLHPPCTEMRLDPALLGVKDVGSGTQSPECPAMQPPGPGKDCLPPSRVPGGDVRSKLGPGQAAGTDSGNGVGWGCGLSGSRPGVPLGAV